MNLEWVACPEEKGELKAIGGVVAPAGSRTAAVEKTGLELAESYSRGIRPQNPLECFLSATNC